jgi:hypothetical protein
MKPTEPDALTLIAWERQKRFDRVLVQIGTWTNEDLDWFVGELEAGNIAPPVADGDEEACTVCGVLTVARFEGAPMCEGCRPDEDNDRDDGDGEEAASDDAEED